jgi:hypothetical protein
METISNYLRVVHSGTIHDTSRCVYYGTWLYVGVRYDYDAGILRKFRLGKIRLGEVRLG